jgi:hypothetical protein
MCPYCRCVPPHYALNKRKEWLNRAYVEAICTTAGYRMQVVTDDLEGTDIEIRDGAVVIELQLKATAAPDFGDAVVNFDLDVSTYNKLRDPVRSAPGYLAVMHLPSDPDEWIVHSAADLLVRHCVYWKPLAGAPDTTNEATQRVKVPTDNLFDVSSLREAMAAARARLT